MVFFCHAMVFYISRSKSVSHDVYSSNYCPVHSIMWSFSFGFFSLYRKRRIINCYNDVQVTSSDWCCRSFRGYLLFALSYSWWCLSWSSIQASILLGFFKVVSKLSLSWMSKCFVEFLHWVLLSMFVNFSIKISAKQQLFIAWAICNTKKKKDINRRNNPVEKRVKHWGPIWWICFMLGHNW